MVTPGCAVVFWLAIVVSPAHGVRTDDAEKASSLVGTRSWNLCPPHCALCANAGWTRGTAQGYTKRSKFRFLCILRDASLDALGYYQIEERDPDGKTAEQQQNTYPRGTQWTAGKCSKPWLRGGATCRTSDKGIAEEKCLMQAECYIFEDKSDGKEIKGQLVDVGNADSGKRQKIEFDCCCEKDADWPEEICLSGPENLFPDRAFRYRKHASNLFPGKQVLFVSKHEELQWRPNKDGPCQIDGNEHKEYDSFDPAGLLGEYWAGSPELSSMPSMPKRGRVTSGCCLSTATETFTHSYNLCSHDEGMASKDGPMTMPDISERASLCPEKTQTWYYEACKKFEQVYACGGSTHGGAPKGGKEKNSLTLFAKGNPTPRLVIKGGNPKAGQQCDSKTEVSQKEGGDYDSGKPCSCYKFDGGNRLTGGGRSENTEQNDPPLTEWPGLT